MSTLNFETSMESIERKKEKKPKMTVVIDGREMKVRFPKETQVLLAQSAARKGDYSRFMDLLFNVFPSEEDQAYLMDRIDDDDDPFDLVDDEDPDGTKTGGVTLYVIFLRIIEEMSARPTGSRSGSSASSKTSGSRSTGGARVKAKRRATSPSTAS